VELIYKFCELKFPTITFILYIFTQYILFLNALQVFKFMQQ